MKKIIFILFCFLSINTFGQKTPDFYFQKSKSQILNEFSDSTSYKIKKIKTDSIEHIDIYCLYSTWALKFFFDKNEKSNLIVFATLEHETASLYVSNNDSKFGSNIFVDGVAQWTNKKIVVSFSYHDNSIYPYQFTYSPYYEKQKK